MAKVVLADTGSGLETAVTEVFEPFGGGRNLLKKSGKVLIKVNGIDFKPHVYTSPEVVGALVRYFFKAGASQIYVMENSTQGNITRLVFSVTGMDRMCAQTGAIPVYLDETAEVPLYLETLQSFVQIPDFIHDHLILNRRDHLYISVPKLKTHSMTTVTLGIKNQFGLIHQRSRIPDHNFKLHQKIADIFKVIQPDFTVIDGIEATNFGHYPCESQSEKCVHQLNLLCGGNDPLAVDIVGARLLGFGIEKVPHLQCAAAFGTGEGRFEAIDMVNPDLFHARARHFSWDLLECFPEDVAIVRGRTRCCTEGCKRNTEAVLEVFAQDFNGRGGFSIVMGKDADPDRIQGLKGPVHIAGDCAIADFYQLLSDRLGRKNVTTSPGCNNLAATVAGLSKWMHVPPLKLVPMNPVKALMLLVQAKLNGTKANIPPILRF